jgi:amino acid adenylation domain-containing protein
MNTPTTIPALIREQALAHPDRTAAESGEQALTYGELMQRADTIASRLRAAGVEREDIVACCVPRGLATVTSALGVWLAAGTLLAIDPAAPPTRTEHMLRDSGTKIVILDEDGDSAATPLLLANHVETALTLDAAGALTGGREEARTAATGSDLESNPSDLAYLVYTSGTTGLPKGVLIEHASLANMAAAHQATLHPRGAVECRRVALNAVTTADTFFSDLVNLAYGRTLAIVDDRTRRDAERLARFLAERRIDVFDGTPTQIRMLLLGGYVQALQSLKVLIVGNEPTDMQLWTTLRNLPGVRVHNFYGPTECTVDATSAALSESEYPVIGKPLPGSEIWLIDSSMRPVADGQVGEICVAGACLARGYLHPSDADAARFVRLHPESGGAVARAYRTGDRARRTPAGHLEFLGRLDDQVKIAGHRVEPREVEVALRLCDGVLDAAVGVCKDGEAAALAAWVVLAPGVGVDHVAAALGEKLPLYMRPKLTEVSSVPMGPAGKADITALLQLHTRASKPELSASTQQQTTTDDTTETLAAIWCDVLGIAAVNGADDFFTLGGDSLKATRMIVAVRDAVAPAVPIRTIFDHSSFDTFVAAINDKAER